MPASAASAARAGAEGLAPVKTDLDERRRSAVLLGFYTPAIGKAPPVSTQPRVVSSQVFGRCKELPYGTLGAGELALLLSFHPPTMR